MCVCVCASLLTSHNSESGNLYFSFIWTSKEQASEEVLNEMLKLNFAVPVAVVEACQAHGVCVVCVCVCVCV